MDVRDSGTSLLTLSSGVKELPTCNIDRDAIIQVVRKNNLDLSIVFDQP